MVSVVCAVLIMQGCGIGQEHRPADGEVFWSGSYHELLRLVAIGDSAFFLSLGEDSEDTPSLFRLHPDGRPEFVWIPQVACRGWLDLVGLVLVSTERADLIAHCDAEPDDEYTVFTFDASSGIPEVAAFARYHAAPAAWDGTAFVGFLKPGTSPCGLSGGLVWVGGGGVLPRCAIPGAQPPALWTGTDLLYGCPPTGEKVVNLCRGVPGGPSGAVVVSGFAEYDGVTVAGPDVVVAGQPGTGRPGVFRVSATGMVERIATGVYKSPMVDRRTGEVLALKCDERRGKCRSVVRLSR